MHFARLKRREFMTLLGGVAVAWPLAAHPQQPERMRRVGALMGFAESDREGQIFIAAFREGLQTILAVIRNDKIVIWGGIKNVESSL